MPILPGQARNISAKNLPKRLITLVEERARQGNPQKSTSITSDINVLAAEIIRRCELAAPLDKPQLEKTQLVLPVEETDPLFIVHPPKDYGS
jgi:hypothetical protein